MKKILLLLLFPLLSLNAQTFAETMSAYENRDYKKFLELNLKMDSIRPMNPAVSYNLALSYFLNGDNENAFMVLKRATLMDNRTSIDTDADFAPFLQTDYYKELQKLHEKLDTPVAYSKKVVTLSEKSLHPEGLEYVEGRGWLATSVHKRKIVSFDIKTGVCTDWLAEKDMLAVFSLKSSNDGKYLWAATAAIPEMENYNASLEGRAEVLKIDIKTKKIVKRFSVPGNHVFGDLLVTNAGVYVSDSGTPVIYRIEGNTMSEWLNFGKEAFNLQGITTDSKGKLFVADYRKGICVISLKDKSHHWLVFPEGTIQKGIDGLTYYNNSLIAIHNGVMPIRIVRYVLNEKHDALPAFAVIDHKRPEFNEPVLGTVYKDGFYFFANSPWGAYNKEFDLDESLFGNPELFMFPLKK